MVSRRTIFIQNHFGFTCHCGRCEGQEAEEVEALLMDFVEGPDEQKRQHEMNQAHSGVFSRHFQEVS